MASETIDINALELRFRERVARYQRKYRLANADLAWIFLRIGTNYYFKDICHREINGNGMITGRNGDKP